MINDHYSLIRIYILPIFFSYHQNHEFHSTVYLFLPPVCLCHTQTVPVTEHPGLFTAVAMVSWDHQRGRYQVMRRDGIRHIMSHSDQMHTKNTGGRFITLGEIPKRVIVVALSRGWIFHFSSCGLVCV